MSLIVLSLPLMFLGAPDGGRNLRVAPSQDPVGRYGIYELTVTHDESPFSNPWEDVTLLATFDGPEGRTIQIDGFYYDRDTWKVRFSPPAEGVWQVSLHLEDGGEAGTWTGRFECVPSARRGFLRRHPDNPFRLVYEDGSLFDGIGIGDCILDARKSGNPLDSWGFDGKIRDRAGGDPDYGWVVGTETYMAAYGREGAGFNLFRWSIDNCAFKLWDTISPEGNRYLVREGKWGDDLVESLRRHGFRIWLTFFGFQPAFPDAAGSPGEQEAVKRYLRYVVARYGAYVDIWELMNEANVPDEWITFAAEYVRQIDPYLRMVTTSWERPALPAIDINAPHWYQKEPELRSDVATARKIREAKKYGKPVIFGEQGNSVQNWDERSALRMRIRSWTAFFEEGILIFWNSSFAKDYKSGAANLYIGPEERRMIRALRDYTAKVPADIVRFDFPIETEGVRGYGLRSDRVVLGYLHHHADHENPVSAAVGLDLPSKGRVQWIDPASGRVLQELEVTGGDQSFETPPFVVDLALRIDLGDGGR